MPDFDIPYHTDIMERLSGLDLEAARRVAEIMAEEMGKDATWIDEQVEAFVKVSNNYIVC